MRISSTYQGYSGRQEDDCIRVGVWEETDEDPRPSLETHVSANVPSHNTTTNDMGSLERV